MIVAQQVVNTGVVPDVLKEDVECLKELDANVAPRVLVQDVEEERQHVALQEEAESR